MKGLPAIGSIIPTQNYLAINSCSPAATSAESAILSKRMHIVSFNCCICGPSLWDISLCIGHSVGWLLDERFGSDKPVDVLILTFSAIQPNKNTFFASFLIK